MKIAIVHTSDFGGGAERSVVSLHRQLVSMGHESTLFVGAKTLDDESIVAIPYVRGMPGLRRLARAAERQTGWQDIYNPSFRNLLNVIPEDTDVVHFNSLWGSNGYADLGALPAITDRFPSVATLREGWLLTGHCACFFDCQRWKLGCGRCPDLSRAPAISRDGTHFNWKRKQKIIQRSKLRVIAISDWLANQAKLSPILKNQCIETVHNGVDCDVFCPTDTQTRDRLRNKLGIPSNKAAMLVAGQAVEGIRENIAQEWIEAVNRNADRNTIVVIVGHSAEKVATRVRVPTLCIPFRTTPGEMAECFQAADFTVVTSAFEAFGRVAAESQACGCPVISFDTGGLPEVVKDDCGGILVQKGNVDSLATAIRKLVSHADVRMRLGRGGLNYVRDRFSNQSICRSYLSQYQSEISARENDGP